jgi:hypothetical protein
MPNRQSGLPGRWRAGSNITTPEKNEAAPFSDPVHVFAAVGKQHRSQLPIEQELISKPLVVTISLSQMPAFRH